ncbi:hypothetical protein D3C72_2422370 [compost metagenome]
MPKPRMRSATMRKPREERNRKGMKDRHGEQNGGDDLKGLGHVKDFREMDSSDARAARQSLPDKRRNIAQRAAPVTQGQH